MIHNTTWRKTVLKSFIPPKKDIHVKYSTYIMFVLYLFFFYNFFDMKYPRVVLNVINKNVLLMEKFTIKKEKRKEK